MEGQDIKNNKILLRYSAITSVNRFIEEEHVSLEEALRRCAEKGIKDPNEIELKYYKVPSIKRWYRNFKKYGIAGITPHERSDRFKMRKLTEDVQQAIDNLKSDHPRMTATSVRKKLIELGIIKDTDVSLTTVTRYINRNEEIGKYELVNQPDHEMKRYELPHINQVWCADTTYGPYIKLSGHSYRTYIIAIIDDASRMIVGIGLFLKDNYVNFMQVLKSAVSKYGVPKLINLDNGSTYKNKQMQLLAVRLGTETYYNPPYRPQGKAKIERFFLTLKEQFFANILMDNYENRLTKLQEDLLDYVNATYNKTPHSSLSPRRSPYVRYFEEHLLIKRLSEDTIEDSFLLEVERRVSQDGVIMIDNKAYEVDSSKYAKRKVTIRYACDQSNFYLVDPEDGLIPIKRLDKHMNAYITRNHTPRKPYSSRKHGLELNNNPNEAINPLEHKEALDKAIAKEQAKEQNKPTKVLFSVNSNAVQGENAELETTNPTPVNEVTTTSTETTPTATSDTSNAQPMYEDDVLPFEWDNEQSEG